MYIKIISLQIIQRNSDYCNLNGINAVTNEKIQFSPLTFYNFVVWVVYILHNKMLKSNLSMLLEPSKTQAQNGDICADWVKAEKHSMSFKPLNKKK